MALPGLTARGGRKPRRELWARIEPFARSPRLMAGGVRAFLGRGHTMYIRTQSRWRSPALPIIGAGIAIYAGCAVVFHLVIEPTLARNDAPAPISVAQSPE